MQPDRFTFLGVAGSMATEQDRALVKQVVFLLRYRARLADVIEREGV